MDPRLGVRGAGASDIAECATCHFPLDKQGDCMGGGHPRWVGIKLRRSIGFAPVELLPQLEGGGSNAQGGTLVQPKWPGR